MRTGLTGLIVLGLLTSSAAVAGAPGWSVSETSGQVSVVSTGLVKVATRGGPVAIGDVINTGRDGRAVLVRGEEYLVVSPNSRISVADPVKSGSLTQIVEQFGNVIYKIKKMTMPHFAVETPFLAAVVKGTTFSVTVTDKGASVQVIEGRVEVATRDGGASFLVLPGDIGSVSATAPGRLNVQGRENRSIDSPTPAAAAAAAVSASVEAGNAVTSNSFEGTIVTAISEGPVRLDILSKGLVRGDSSLSAMVAKPMQTASLATTAPVVAIDHAANGVTPPVDPTVGPPPSVPAPPVVFVELPPPPLPPIIVASLPPAPLPPVVVEPVPVPLPPIIVASLPPAPLPPVIVEPVPVPLPPVIVAALTPAPLPPVVVALPTLVVGMLPPVAMPNNPIISISENGTFGNGKGNNSNGLGNGGNDGDKDKGKTKNK